MAPSHHLRYRQEGVTLAEVMAVLAILIVLVAIAIPTFSGVTNQAKDAEAKAELREVLVPVKTVNIEDPTTPDLVAAVLAMAPGTAIDPSGVTGVKVERSTDGAICLWRISDSNSVLGMWEPPLGADSPTLFAELATMPATCPTFAQAPAAGFSTTGW
ncbi:MAG: type IV pilin protein [Acidimicrobiia bacterium]